MNRYRILLEIVRDLKPKHIIEIGTWNGKRAIEFMAASDCFYTGFDLFEEATKATDKRELNVKDHNGLVDVGRFIKTAGFNKFCLFRGDTNETLKEYFESAEPFDFAFIDGGHSVATIKNDYKFISQNIMPGGTIIIDDWYDPEIGGFGCNFLEEHGAVLPAKNRTSRGYVHLLKIEIPTVQK